MTFLQLHPPPTKRAPAMNVARVATTHTKLVVHSAKLISICVADINSNLAPRIHPRLGVLICA